MQSTSGQLGPKLTTHKKGRNFHMDDKDNYLKTAELSTEQNTNMIDGIANNAPLAPPVPEPDGGCLPNGGRLPEVKPLDKVKEIPRRKRSRELER
jgi:hypothetical protein